MSAHYESWKNRALDADILAEAQSRGAELRRIGREWIGPCPVCGGDDRFSVNEAKQIFNCRGAVGGDVIALVMHLDGCSFMEAVEALTGGPPPSGKSNPLTAEQLAARAKRASETDEARRKREAKEAARAEDAHEAALAIWYQSKPLAGTIAERYLNRRGIPMPAEGWPPVLRGHPALPYPGGAKYPALVCRVDDVLGDLTAVWRIYVTANGDKAPVSNCKLGLGPASGGAVRLGGLAPKIGIAEGIETAFGAWLLTGMKYPVWAALSTAGMVGIELPIAVRDVTIFADGDQPMRRKDGVYEPAEPPGRRAAQSLLAKLNAQKIKARVAAEPPPGMDYLDLWAAKEVA